MKLLITTQIVAEADPRLGFFCTWLREFAKHCEHITVVCLQEGEHHLPANVRVLSLGKEKGTGKLERVIRFYRYTAQYRHEYDAVFVHMNPEYVVLGGILWRLWHKKIALWYMHKSVNLKLRIATMLAHVIFTASPASFRLKTGKLKIVGHGIDVNFFTPDPSVPREDWYLSVGRLTPSKRHDLAIGIAAQAGHPLKIVGEGPEQAGLEAFARYRGAKVEFVGGRTQKELVDYYRRAALFVHTSETGSLDKVVLEALACGLPVVSRDPALKDIQDKGPEYVREHHSLFTLIPRILKELA